MKKWDIKQKEKKNEFFPPPSQTVFYSARLVGWMNEFNSDSKFFQGNQSMPSKYQSRETPPFIIYCLGLSES
jgi:hypothetical protein